MNCRKAVAVVLLMLLALEIVPCLCLETSTLATDAPGSFSCSLVSLQVCDQGDSLLGSLVANLPVLIPEAAILLPSPEVLCLVPDRASFALDGFRPSIDHPPQLSA